MRTSFIDAVLRRADRRPPTDGEVREREKRRRNASQLVSEIAASSAPPSRAGQKERQLG